ncbi:hypothetical protein B0O99DRAFT_590414 [Bisporella sp. PMI_857]|nr:hypothetical protein B0O99DRAFT_590414 [Bisporella sp. PMI_857]
MHIVCAICDVDFKTRPAYKLHRDQKHAKEQDLECPGACGIIFPRVGALISHIELTPCRGITGYSGRKEEIERGDGAYDRIRTHAELAGNSCDNTNSTHQLQFQQAQVGQISSGTATTPFQGEQQTEVINDLVQDLEENLIDLGLGSWDEMPVRYTIKAQADQCSKPAASIATSSVISSIHRTSIATSSPIPAAQPVNDSTVFASPACPGPITSAQIPSTISPVFPNNDGQIGQKFHHFDPQHPEFRVHRFYIPQTRKYKCPSPGCTKSFSSPNGFVQHLNSPIHMSDMKKNQCVKCLKYFMSSTALVQHVESQSTRCDIRQASHFDNYIDRLTAHTVALEGKHEDDTNRYRVQNFGINAADKVAALNAQIHIEAAENRTNFWKEKGDLIKW